MVKKVERDGSLTHVASGVNGPANATALAAAGQNLMLFYWYTGDVEVWEITSGDFARRALRTALQFQADRMIPHENGVVLFQDAVQTSFAYGFRATDSGAPIRLREYMPRTNAFDEQWADALTIGVLS